MSNQLKALDLLKEELYELKQNEIPLHSYIPKRICNLESAIEELEALEYKDRLAELEKVILDYYLAKGYQIGVGGWNFKVLILTKYKNKKLLVYFKESELHKWNLYFGLYDKKTTKLMFDKAIEHFKIVDKKDS